MQSFSTAKHQQTLEISRSNASVVSDSKVIVDGSEPHIEPDGAYGKD